MTPAKFNSNPKNAPWFLRPDKIAWDSLSLFLLAGIAYAITVGFNFIQDDFYVVVQNSLLNSWSSLPTLLTADYCAFWGGSSVLIHELRPVTLLSFFLQVHTTGHAAWAFHLGNVLLHAAATATLYWLLKKIIRPSPALWASVLFAVHPSHVEAVAHISNRGELLSAAFILLAWALLLEKRLIEGILCFSLALLSKETAAVFPAVFLVFDWVINGKGARKNLKTHAALWAALVPYFGLRMLLLPQAIKGGAPYFGRTTAWVKLLTLSQFWFRYYLIPTVSGLGSGLNFKRPFFPDASATNPWAVILLIGWVSLFCSALWAVRNRRVWGFWIVQAGFFLLPTSHLVFELDTIGAERFLYLPSIGFCVLASMGLDAVRIRSSSQKLIVAGLATWYGVINIQHSLIWKDAPTFYSAVLTQNPKSSIAHFELGLGRIRENQPGPAEAEFREAIRLDPANPTPYYNLGKLLFGQGHSQEAKMLFQQSIERSPDSPDVLVFLGVIAEKEGHINAAIQWYLKALQILPWDSDAHYNLGRLYQALGDKPAAEAHWKEFLRLAPDDPAGEEVRHFLR